MLDGNTLCQPKFCCRLIKFPPLCWFTDLFWCLTYLRIWCYSLLIVMYFFCWYCLAKNETLLSACCPNRSFLSWKAKLSIVLWCFMPCIYIFSSFNFKICLLYCEPGHKNENLIEKSLKSAKSKQHLWLFSMQSTLWGSEKVHPLLLELHNPKLVGAVRPQRLHWSLYPSVRNNVVPLNVVPPDSLLHCHWLR